MALGVSLFQLRRTCFQDQPWRFLLNVSIDTKSINLFRYCQVRATSIERTICIEYIYLHEVYVNQR